MELSSTKSAPRKFYIHTLGCKANLSDGHVLEAQFRSKGWIQARSLQDPALDVCVINSCTVTDEADRQSRRMASRLRRNNPGAQVVLTGCAAEVQPEVQERSAGIHFVVSNRDKGSLVELVEQALESPKTSQDALLLGQAIPYAEMASRHPIDREWPSIEELNPTESCLSVSGTRTRAFLKIQDGCNAFCTYCVIPYARGPNRSLSIQDVVARVQALVAAGTREVILTGINLGDYGTDWSESFQLSRLVQTLLSETETERLRISSLDPTEITDELLDLMERDPRVCPHLHVSLQSPHSRILKLMKRKYGFAELEQKLFQIQRLKTRMRPFVGMDIIAGFPGETPEEFDWSLDALAALPWDRLHVFPYSERDGTPATRLGGSVPLHERARRAAHLRELSLRRLQARYQAEWEQNPVVRSVLIEAASPGWVGGHSPNYLRVQMPLPMGYHLGDLRNQVVDLRITGIVQDSKQVELSYACELA